MLHSFHSYSRRILRSVEKFEVLFNFKLGALSQILKTSGVTEFAVSKFNEFFDVEINSLLSEHPLDEISENGRKYTQPWQMVN